MLVIGSTNSSNSNRLVEVAREHGAASHLIDNHTQVEEEWLEGVETVGITSGASAPEELVEALVEFFRERGAERRLRAARRSTRTSASCCRRRSATSSRLAGQRRLSRLERGSPGVSRPAPGANQTDQTRAGRRARCDCVPPVAGVLASW